MSRILTVEEVAAMLRCEPATVREKTPAVLPGVKFGRDWVYAESVIIRCVEELSTEMIRRPRRNRETHKGSRAQQLPELGGEV